MSLITGRVETYGAAVDVLVGVSRNREAALLRVGHPVPAKLPLRLIIDTGAYSSGLAAAVFPLLDITSVSQTNVRTTFTTRESPQLADIYDVSLSLVSGLTVVPLPSVLVLCSPDFRLDEPVHGILGRDILRRCVFNYVGTEDIFSLAF